MAMQPIPATHIAKRARESKQRQIRKRMLKILTAVGVFLATLGNLSPVYATCSRTPPPPPSTSSPPDCRQLSQREMQTRYINCFVDRHFDMSINVEIEDYGIFTSRANQVLDSNEFLNSFDSMARDNCLRDRLQPKNKHWQYVCDYSSQRIPQTRWSVECHQNYNPCRNKTIQCLCDNTQFLKETSTCSDGIARTLDCTGACSADEDSCFATYSIAQEWKEVNKTTMYLELIGGVEFLELCKVTPMEVYLNNKWKLRREQVTVACTCEEQLPVRQ